MRTQTAEIHPIIEFPQENEAIVSRTYTMRIAVPAVVEALDISIDQGPWLACREDVGYWWYAWSGYEDGKHEIVARSRAHNGRWRMSEPRDVIVATMA